MSFACSVILAADITGASSIIGIVRSLYPLHILDLFAFIDDRDTRLQSV